MKPLSSLTAVYAAVTIVTLLAQILQARTLNSNQTELPAILVFGDSLVDPGNNNVLPTIVKSNFPPYGQDFAGHRATGRFSNGKLATDLLVEAENRRKGILEMSRGRKILLASFHAAEGGKYNAERLGLKELIPAYLDPQLKPQDLLTGVSFASAGTGYDDLTAKLVSVLSMPDQLALFKEYMGKLQALVGEERARNTISDSFYIVCAGNNDMIITYFNTPFRRKEFSVPSYTDLMLEAASTFVQELYNLGARKIGVVGLPPLGCLPNQRTLAGGIQRECVAPYNQAAVIFNSKLSKELQLLSSHHLNARIFYIDFYNPAVDIVQHFLQYGFDEESKGCCGAGEVELAITCNELSPHTCSDATKYVFFDSIHPTQQACEIFVAKSMDKIIAQIS